MHRYYGSCGLILDKNGQKVVAIIGGYTGKGMEFWNPENSTIELLSDEIPPERSGLVGLRNAEIVPVNGGKEFILYGGWHGSTEIKIWKYVSLNNTWTRY